MYWVNWDFLGYTGLHFAVLGCTGMYWDVLGCTGLHWSVLGSTWLYLDVLGCTGLSRWSNVDQVDQMNQVIQVVQVVQVVKVVRMISVDDMHSDNICFSWSKPSNYKSRKVEMTRAVTNERKVEIIAISFHCLISPLTPPPPLPVGTNSIFFLKI